MAHERYTIEELLQLTRKNWPAADTTGHEFIMTVARVMESVGQRHLEVAETYGLTPVEFDVLATLRKVGPPYEMTPTELQQAVVISSGGLTKVLHQLEARALVGRSIDAKDRRSKRVRLTREGKTLIERAMAKVLSAQEEWLASLPARELKQLVQLLRKALAVTELHKGPSSP